MPKSKSKRRRYQPPPRKKPKPSPRWFGPTILSVMLAGVIAACKAVNLQVPLVVRMKGTNEVEGKKLLADSGLPIISADTMADAAQKVVAAVKAKA